GGVLGLLLPRQAELPQGPADDHPAAGDAQFPLQRPGRGIGGLLDELAEPLQGVAVEGRLDPAAVGPGLEGAGLAAELEQPRDGRGVDLEPGGEFPSGALAVGDDVEDAWAEIIRQGLHESPPEEMFSKSCAKRMCSAVTTIKLEGNSHLTVTRDRSSLR